jgi:hypothetical protein
MHPPKCLGVLQVAFLKYRIEQSYMACTLEHQPIILTPPSVSEGAALEQHHQQSPTTAPRATARIVRRKQQCCALLPVTLRKDWMDLGVSRCSLAAFKFCPHGCWLLPHPRRGAIRSAQPPTMSTCLKELPADAHWQSTERS